MHTEGANHIANARDDKPPDIHGDRLREHIFKIRADFLRVQRGEGADGDIVAITDKPACNGNIKHHQNKRTNVTEPAEHAPALGGAEFMITARHCFLRGASRGKLHDHDRQAYCKQKEKVGDKEEKSSVFADDIGKTPNVSKPDGAACGKQKKA